MLLTIPDSKKKIVIYGLGDYGLETYFRLKERGIKISCFADRNPQKRGYVLDELYCYSYEEVLHEDKENSFLIIAIQKCEEIINEFKQMGFQNVYDGKTVIQILEAKKEKPQANCLLDIRLIEELKQNIQDAVYHNKKEVHKDLENIVSDYIRRHKEQEKRTEKPGKISARILEINVSDLSGHVFNGYDLHLNLIKRGISAGQIVLDKKSRTESVKALSKDLILHYQIREFERVHSINNFLYPCGEELLYLPEYQSADLVHYHILYNGVASLLDYPRLMNSKKSVWTIHDPWIITGNCLYPLSCEKWKTGCGDCDKTDEILFKLSNDTTNFMWNQKKAILSQIDPHIIVSCGFMKDYLKQSPMTQHFSKIHIIPFGIDSNKYTLEDRKKHQYRKSNNKIVIGFRSDRLERKGCKYIYQAFRKLDAGKKIKLLCVGNEAVPTDIKDKYDTTELGWIDEEIEMIKFYQSCDIFLMPSLAETFGLMAIEAMAAGCTVICFRGTVLETVICAPECGIAVEYQSAEALANAIRYLLRHPGELIGRGEKGHQFVEERYSFDTYVDRHIELYHEIMEEP